MLWTIVLVLLVLWLLGVVALPTVGSLIHILLVLALVWKFGDFDRGDPKLAKGFDLPGLILISPFAAMSWDGSPAACASSGVTILNDMALRAVCAISPSSACVYVVDAKWMGRSPQAWFSITARNWCAGLRMVPGWMVNVTPASASRPFGYRFATLSKVIIERS